MKNLKEFTAELKQKNLAGYWETAGGRIASSAGFRL